MLPGWNDEDHLAAFRAYVGGCAAATHYLVTLGVDWATGIDPAWRLLLVTGLLGALTTFSTFSAEALALLQQGRVATALLHSGLHLLGSLLLAWLGVLSGQGWWGKAG